MQPLNNHTHSATGDNSHAHSHTTQQSTTSAAHKAKSSSNAAQQQGNASVNRAQIQQRQHAPTEAIAPQIVTEPHHREGNPNDSQSMAVIRATSTETEPRATSEARNAIPAPLHCCQCGANVTHDNRAETVADEVYCFYCYNRIPTRELIRRASEAHKRQQCPTLPAPLSSPMRYTATHLPLDDMQAKYEERWEQTRQELRRSLKPHVAAALLAA